MNIPEKVTEVVNTLISKVTPEAGDDEELHAREGYADPDEFDNYSDYDSLMVDSKEGAPE